MNLHFRMVGVPDISLILTRASDAENKLGQFSFDEDPDNGTAIGAVLKLDGKQLFIQSTQDPKSKVLVGTTQISLRDAQEILPRCHIGSDNSASTRFVKFTALNPLSVVLTEIKRVCVAQEWKADAPAYKLADGNRSFAIGSAFTTYRPNITKVLQISDGKQSVLFESPVGSANMNLLSVSRDALFLGFGLADNCNNYVQNFKL